MEERRYRVIFQGKVVPGNDVEIVKKNLSAFFEVDMNEIHQLFSGKPFVLKENVTKDEAIEFITRMEKTGALCKRVRMTSSQPGPVTQHRSFDNAENKKTGYEEKITALHYEARFRLMFSGEIAVDKDLNEVKTNLSMFYMVKPEKLEGLFTGQPVVIKGDMDFWKAVAYLNRINACGALAYLEKQEGPETIAEEKEKFKVVFCQELQKGFDLLTVKTALSSLFNIPGIVVDKLFIEEPVLVRYDLSAEAAQAFKKDFEKTGALCQVLSISEKPLLSKSKVAQIKPPASETVHTVKQEEVKPVKKADPQPSRPQPQRKVETQTKPLSPSQTLEKQFPAPQAAPSRPTRRATRPMKLREKNNTILVIAIAGIFVALFIIFKMLSAPSGQESKPASVKQESPITKTVKKLSPQSQAETSPDPSLKRGILPDEAEMFQDNNNYFYISLPGGCKVSDRSSGNQSRVSYDYTVHANVSISAIPIKNDWNPEEALKKKMNDIQEGKEKQLSLFDIETFGLVDFNGFTGYEIVLKKNDQMAHLFALINPNKVFYAISISTRGRAMQENHDILESAIRDSISY